MCVRALWCAVLRNALDDASTALPANAYFAGAGSRSDARSYVLVPNPDFALVCHLAGFDPDVVRQAFLRRFAGGAEAAAPPQPASRSSARTFTHAGITLTLREWADRTGMSYELLRDRIGRRGWSIARALREPAGRRMPKPSRSQPAQVAHILEQLMATQGKGATGEAQRSPLQRRQGGG